MSFLPIAGSIAGGLGLGGLLGGGKKFLLGEKAKAKQFPTLTPEQKALQDQLISGLGGLQGSGLEFLQGILSQDPEALAQFEAPALRQFQEQIIPQISERFGGLGALSSSGFQQTLGQAAERLQEGLSAQRGQLGFQALQGLQGLRGQALQPQFQTGITSPTSGAIQQVIAQLIANLPKLIGG